ncbi:MAG: hypothetical protein GXP29_14840 [Planctomycetes bacterium]|nr:hypothetical protein [Planctomycetota bacterium]
MKNLIISCTILAVFSATVAVAKRSAPDRVAPVTSGHIEYRAPHSQMGCVEAWDIRQDQLIWRRQIHIVKYTIGLERDVQDVYIKTLELKGDMLIVKNERESEYQLDLDSLHIKVLKGSLVETRK